MSEHLPTELHHLLENKEFNIKSDKTVLNVVVEEDKKYGCVTIGIGPDQAKEDKFNPFWMYITFKNRLWFQSTIFDCTGRDFIDGGEFGQYTTEQIQEITKDTIDNLKVMFTFDT